MYVLFFVCVFLCSIAGIYAISQASDHVFSV